MISVKEARERMLGTFRPMPAEQVALAAAVGRVLAEDVVARRTQPPVALSAMDGYAVRAADVAAVPARLTVVGQAPAGGAYAGTVGPGQAVRIFTGGPLPDGADTIVIQEDTEADGTAVTVLESAAKGRHVRPAGLDFRAGAVGLKAGRRLGAREIGLAAAMDVPWLQVRRKPRIALLATGDEIVMPGDPVGPNQIVSSNVPALAAFVAEHGGRPIDLGIARDTVASLRDKAAGAVGADLLVTSGGASVGDHDLVQEALGKRGLDIDFWRIAMRPGKPLMFGRFGEVPLLGLPGNPVSSLVCALLFLGPIIRQLLGLAETAPRTMTARLGTDLDANDRREDYMRARLTRDGDGELVATPFPKQDSSMISLLVEAGCLVIRAPQAPAAKAGDPVEIIPLTPA
jgi:molybdopterin molybdotransferase